MAKFCGRRVNKLRSALTVLAMSLAPPRRQARRDSVRISKMGLPPRNDRGSEKTMR